MNMNQLIIMQASQLWEWLPSREKWLKALPAQLDPFGLPFIVLLRMMATENRQHAGDDEKSCPTFIRKYFMFAGDVRKKALAN